MTMRGRASLPSRAGAGIAPAAAVPLSRLHALMATSSVTALETKHRRVKSMAGGILRAVEGSVVRVVVTNG